MTTKSTFLPTEYERCARCVLRTTCTTIASECNKTDADLLHLRAESLVCSDNSGFRTCRYCGAEQDRDYPYSVNHADGCSVPTAQRG